MLIYAKWAGIALVILFVVTFAIKNSQPVTTSYYVIGDVIMPQYTLLGLFLLIGIVLGAFMSFLAGRNKHKAPGREDNET